MKPYQYGQYQQMIVELHSRLLNMLRNADDSETAENVLHDVLGAIDDVIERGENKITG